MSEEIVVYGEEDSSIEKHKEIKRGEDYEYARKNIKKVIDDSIHVAQTIKNIAEETENARFFEAYINLTNVISANNKILFDMENESQNDEKDSEQINNNTLILATTTDVQKMIEKKIKEAGGGR